MEKFSPLGPPCSHTPMFSLARHSAPLSFTARRAISVFAAVPAGPPDPILGNCITEAFKADKDPLKINLGVGAYRDENGKPYVLSSVKKAEETVANSKPDKEYLPITGFAEFTKNAAKLAYGADSAPLVSGSISVAQSISGTGALRIGGAFLARHYPHSKVIYLPNPSWGNHTPVFRDSGLEVRSYRYFDKDTVGLDFEGLKADLRAAPKKSIVLLHACAHNPTGVDPTHEQWKEISDIVKENELFPFFDMAYQGFATGSISNDAYAGHQIALAQSFAKNMGLYGERVGAFSLTAADPDEKARVDSQLKIIIRPMYSNPPVHGARIANAILANETLYREWEVEVKSMADRIISMREKLYDMLTHDLKTPGEWGHIKRQIGMFSFTGLTAAHTHLLAEKAHIYMTRDGRISMAGLNSKNIEHFGASVDAAVKGNLLAKSTKRNPSNTVASYMLAVSRHFEVARALRISSFPSSMSSTTNLRSPSPTLPGAWPCTSVTCPAMSTPASDSTRPDVASLASTSTLNFSSSRGSRLNGFATLSENSLSALAVNSTRHFSIYPTSPIVQIDTSNTTLAEDDLRVASFKSGSRIHQLPSPETSSYSSYNAYSLRGRFENDIQSDLRDHVTSISRQHSETSSSEYPPSSPTPSPSASPQSTGSPLSPMVFTSGSNRSSPIFRRFRGAVDQSHSCTSIEDAEYDDSGLLRLASPSITSSLGSSAVSTRAFQRQDNIPLIFISPLTNGWNSSIERLQSTSEPAPPSVAVSPGSHIIDSAPGAPLDMIPLQHRSNASGSISLDSCSEQDMAAFRVSSISVPLSPPSLQAQLENSQAAHTVTFPHTPLINEAIDYASAVFSSMNAAAPPIESMTFDFAQVDGHTICNGSNNMSGENSAHAQRVVKPNASWQKFGVLSKVKRFGAKIKKVLRRKSKERPGRGVSSSSVHHQYGSIMTTARPIDPPTLELELGSLDLERDINAASSASSGPLTRARRPRPNITAQTYSLPTVETRNDEVVERNESRPGTRTAHSNDMAFNSSTPVVEIQRQIETCARPKTLEEIKSKRRFSLSAISNHLARPSSPSRSGGPSTIGLVRQRKSRPASALILTSTSTSSQQNYRQHPSISQSIGCDYSLPHPPGLERLLRTAELSIPEDSLSPSSNTVQPPRSDLHSDVPTRS
ncbi:hypothetical protein D9757_002879 [Collybiopsis confluens]|uniref:Aspartate aminotransferase n=1 Tax=Collybiopsis confluens TaxID=2823264 RepID=A0A8H5ME25_9AGAR|nr:hypothetical protein D9757_002879 [Collybiopsis confluens]